MADSITTPTTDTVRIYYRVEIVRPSEDCDHEEPCVAGFCGTLQAGWLPTPQTHLMNLRSDRDDVCPDVLDRADLEEGQTVAQWIADKLLDINPRTRPEDHRDGTVIFNDPHLYNYFTTADFHSPESLSGAAVYRSAHIVGATEDDVAEAHRLINRHCETCACF